MRKYHNKFRSIPYQYTRKYKYRHRTGKFFRKNLFVFSLTHSRYAMYETLIDSTRLRINPFHYMFIVASPKLLNFHKY